MSLLNTQRPAMDKRRRLRPSQISELVVINADGTRREVIFESCELFEAPNWTPDGRWLVVNADGRLYKISPDGREGPIRINTAPIEDLNNDHVLSPNGRVVYLSSRDRHLYAAPFDGGAAKRLSPDQARERQYVYYLHGVSPDGQSLSFVGYEKSGTGDTITRICTMPAAGGAIRELTDGRSFVDGPEYSSDGAWIYFNSEAAATQPGHAQIFRMRADGSTMQQITFDERVNWFPHFSPDGTKVAYLSFPAGTIGHPPDKNVLIRLMDPDGSHRRDLDGFLGGQGTMNVNSWSPDGERLAYVAYPIVG
ncbi:MAG: PD40 domain-containing protein [Acidisphaera sp.]|nr:PD40 domain-containing protein [Acidisphaera sp.]MBV9812669.1 PD40 domain-containing protein [Acetobacteraceae bacterium]